MHVYQLPVNTPNLKEKVPKIALEASPEMCYCENMLPGS